MDRYYPPLAVGMPGVSNDNHDLLIMLPYKHRRNQSHCICGVCGGALSIDTTKIGFIEFAVNEIAYRGDLVTCPDCLQIGYLCFKLPPIDKPLEHYDIEIVAMELFGIKGEIR